MANEIKGISFPFRIGGRGGVVMSSRSTSGEQQHLKENIISIVGTKELERVMNPNFGLEDLDIFLRELNESTATMAKYKIIQKLNMLETRIEVLDVIINELIQEDGSLGYTVDILFKENSSNTVNTTTITMEG